MRTHYQGRSGFSLCAQPTRRRRCSARSRQRRRRILVEDARNGIRYADQHLDLAQKILLRGGLVEDAAMVQTQRDQLSALWEKIGGER